MRKFVKKSYKILPDFRFRPPRPADNRSASRTNAPRTAFFSKPARKTKAEVKKMIDFATRVSYNINDTCVANIVGESL